MFSIQWLIITKRRKTIRERSLRSQPRPLGSPRDPLPFKVAQVVTQRQRRVTATGESVLTVSVEESQFIIFIIFSSFHFLLLTSDKDLLLKTIELCVSWRSRGLWEFVRMFGSLLLCCCSFALLRFSSSLVHGNIQLDDGPTGSRRSDASFLADIGQ